MTMAFQIQFTVEPKITLWFPLYRVSVRTLVLVTEVCLLYYIKTDPHFFHSTNCTNHVTF